ncbi:hypothetical protein Ciccas_004546 [Cichlidogyrus casuarinus]|uniref:Uncharacterized protein n=1 Tax=Cichlidogyrus casuarinus TaxID=1844966 RepID=A0ABD2QBA7_9PLAT
MMLDLFTKCFHLGKRGKMDVQAKSQAQPVSLYPRTVIGHHSVTSPAFPELMSYTTNQFVDGGGIPRGTCFCCICCRNGQPCCCHECKPNRYNLQKILPTQAMCNNAKRGCPCSCCNCQHCQCHREQHSRESKAKPVPMKRSESRRSDQTAVSKLEDLFGRKLLQMYKENEKEKKFSDDSSSNE